MVIYKQESGPSGARKTPTHLHCALRGGAPETFDQATDFLNKAYNRENRAPD